MELELHNDEKESELKEKWDLSTLVLERFTSGGKVRYVPLEHARVAGFSPSARKHTVKYTIRIVCLRVFHLPPVTNESYIDV